MMDALSNLGHCIQVAAGLELSWDLGRDRFGDDADEPGQWYPGCNIPYDKPTVQCVWCCESYLAISREHRQGNDCCAWFYERGGRWWLTGGYGSSEADLTLFAVVQGSNVIESLDASLPRQGRDPVCDRCIRKMVEDGALQRVGETTLEGHHRLD